MSTDWIARGIAATSAAIGLIAFAWAVLSWRLSGPSLRVHALAYREILVVRIFNAGRTAESIEHIVLGGTRGGRNGIDLTDHLSLPLRLEPGETERWRLDPRFTPLVETWPIITAGWASLWVLTGSMRQRRVEVLPLSDARPPTVGWRLVPRRTKLARYAPLLVGLPVAAWSSSPGTSLSETWLVALLGVYVILRGVWVLGSGRQFVRRRVERWALAVGWVLSLIEMGRSASETATAQLPMLDVLLLGLFFAFALVLAVPGAAVEVATVHGLIAERGRRLSARLVARISRARNDREGNKEEFDSESAAHPG